jgi:hypothetical protein
MYPGTHVRIPVGARHRVGAVGSARYKFQNYVKEVYYDSDTNLVSQCKFHSAMREAAL